MRPQSVPRNFRMSTTEFDVLNREQQQLESSSNIEDLHSHIRILEKQIDFLRAEKLQLAAISDLLKKEHRNYKILAKEPGPNPELLAQLSREEVMAEMAEVYTMKYDLDSGSPSLVAAMNSARKARQYKQERDLLEEEIVMVLKENAAAVVERDNAVFKSSLLGARLVFAERKLGSHDEHLSGMKQRMSRILQYWWK